MKKIMGLLLTVSTLLLVSCKEEGTIETKTSSENGITVLCEHYLGNAKYVSFIRDTYTDNIYVTYFEKKGYGGGGGLTPYYNAEGKIMKYDEFKQVHVH